MPSSTTSLALAAPEPACTLAQRAQSAMPVLDPCLASRGSSGAAHLPHMGVEGEGRLRNTASLFLAALSWASRGQECLGAFLSTLQHKTGREATRLDHS